MRARSAASAATSSPTTCSASRPSRATRPRADLRGSSAGRAWAKEVATTLSPLAGGTLPDIPGDGDEPAPAAAPAGAPAAGAPAAAAAPATRNPQLGGRLIAAGIGVVIAIAIIVVLSLGGNDDDPETANTATQTSTGSQTTPSGDQYNVVAAASLLPPKGVQSTAKGDVAIFQFPATGQFRLGLQAQGLPPSSTRGSAYGVWLYSSASKQQFLGFSRGNVGKDGKLETVSDLAPDTPNYGAVLLTRETVDEPKKPGTIILVGQMVTAADEPRSGGTSTTPSTTAPSSTTPTTTTP